MAAIIGAVGSVAILAIKNLKHINPLLKPSGASTLDAYEPIYTDKAQSARDQALERQANEIIRTAIRDEAVEGISLARLMDAVYAATAILDESKTAGVTQKAVLQEPESLLWVGSLYDKFLTNLLKSPSVESVTAQLKSASSDNESLPEDFTRHIRHGLDELARGGLVNQMTFKHKLGVLRNLPGIKQLPFGQKELRYHLSPAGLYLLGQIKQKPLAKFSPSDLKKIQDTLSRAFPLSNPAYLDY